MKALVVVGGFRKKNTWHMAESFTDGLKESGHEVNKIYTKSLQVKPCTGCENCYRTGECIIKDEMSDLYTTIDESEILVIASPLYFFMISSDMKAFIDRGQPFWERTHRRKDGIKSDKKLGIFLACNGGPYQHDAFFATYKPMRTYFGSVGADFSVNYNVSNTDTLPVMDRPEILDEIRLIGKNISKKEKFMIHR